MQATNLVCLQLCRDITTRHVQVHCLCQFIANFCSKQNNCYGIVHTFNDRDIALLPGENVQIVPGKADRRLVSEMGVLSMVSIVKLEQTWCLSQNTYDVIRHCAETAVVRTLNQWLWDNHPVASLFLDLPT